MESTNFPYNITIAAYAVFLALFHVGCYQPYRPTTYHECEETLIIFALPALVIDAATQNEKMLGLLLGYNHYKECMRKVERYRKITPHYDIKL